MDDLVRVVGIEIGQDLCPGQIERRCGGVEHPKATDGDVAIRSRHRVGIDAVGQQDMLVLG